MSLTSPSWRSLPRCLFSAPSTLPIRTRPQRAFLSHTTRRLAENDSSTTTSSTSDKPNPVLDEYRRNNPVSTAGEDQQLPQQGDIGASSIFEDDRRMQEQTQHEEQKAPEEAKDDGHTRVGGIRRNTANMARVLDPNPSARRRFERKKVIQLVKRGGRLSKPQVLKRTEREHLVKSVNFKTSVKKLGMLARQIAGKQIDEAITQMRFSGKKVATELMKQLEFARDEAVVARGMGLGQVVAVEEEGDALPNLNSSSRDVSGTTTPAAAVTKPPGAESIDIQLKDGKRHTVTDRSQIYIDQAWVGRGPYGKLPDYRARGRTFVMRTPWTSISVVLKEEATRVREWQEREAKRRREKIDNVWVHLPDRPVHTKSQWYSW